MTKKEVMELLVLIESIYSNCTFKDETIQQWFEFCTEMDYEKVKANVKNHIRRSPFPPTIADIAVFSFDDNDFPTILQEWITKGRERIESDSKSNKRGPLPAWLAEYSPRRTISN
jgi:Loader and inhibitor of phage G40P